MAAWSGDTRAAGSMGGILIYGIPFCKIHTLNGCSFSKIHTLFLDIHLLSNSLNDQMLLEEAITRDPYTMYYIL